MTMKYVLLTLTLFPIFFFAQAHAQDGNVNQDYVLMLHGIGRSAEHMQPLADALSDEGYEVLNIDYPSTKYEIGVLASWVYRNHVKPLDPERKIHIVGYSMGGLVARALLNQHQPKYLGKLLLLAVPNHGSEMADIVQHILPYQWFYGPAGQQLVTYPNARAHLFGKINAPIGVIAGNTTIDPISSSLIPGDDDGKVSVRSTILEDMTDHITVQSSHMFFPSNEDVHKQTIAFLKDGRFRRTY